MNKITIICSAFNAESTILQMIESVLSQTFEDFNLHIIDDGSIDRTKNIIQNVKDSRVILISRCNHGLTKSLNFGLSKSTSEYIARIDADDIWYPNKLMEQVKFLDYNKEYGIVGTNFDEFSSDPKWKSSCSHFFVKDHHDIMRAFPFSNPFLHSSVMIRLDVLKKVGFYDENYTYAQDYELWGRVLSVCKGYNLPEILSSRRYSNNMISVEKEQSQRYFAVKVKFKYFKLVENKTTFFKQILKDLFVCFAPVQVANFLRGRST